MLPSRVLFPALLVLTLLSAARAEVVITEFMAANTATLADEDGAFSDWIELRNKGASPIDLAGWHLTDKADFNASDPLTVWTFPSRVLPPGGYLVVFASGKDRKPAAPGNLHTGFQLASNGEFLALVNPDGTTIATQFAPKFPPQRNDVSYGSGQISLNTVTYLDEGAATRVHVPANDGLGSTWRGGSEPFDDAAWLARNTGVGFDAGGGPSGFTLVDDFEALNLGALGGQGGWSTSAANVTVGIDPANAENQVMRQTTDSVRAWKTMNIPNGSTATVFFRMRRDGIVNISAGTSDIAVPTTNFADFETQVNNQNDALLKVRAGAAFLDVDAFADATWYSIWMVVDNAADTYKVYMKGGALAQQTLLDSATAQTVFGFRNGSAANALVNFYARTGSATTGIWSIDDVYLATGQNLGDPSGGLGFGSFLHANGNIEAAMRNVNTSAYLRLPFNPGSLPPLASLTLSMRYDDGFAAFLNGVEIARRNAPASLAFNGAATSERPNQDAIVFEDIDVASFASSLLPNQTNVLALHALNISASDGDLLLTPKLVAVESAAAPQSLFFTSPTPGAANGAGILGFVADTRFDIDRGFFSAPFNTTITCATSGATIVYTKDGSLPTLTNGVSGPSPLVAPIMTTTPLRAAAFRDGYRPSNVDTQTYIFPADVVNQNNTPPGYPATWKGTGGVGTLPADYAMDPEITGNATYGPLMVNALKAIPTISLVTDKANFFDPATGIYQNPQQSGLAWERPVSFEILNPDGTPGLQVDAGIRMQGGHTREPAKNPKHSFRVNFKSIYGDSKLAYDLFPGDRGAAREFDQLILRGGGNQSWLHHNEFMGDNRGRAQYIRDQWAKDVQLAMGHPAVRNTYAHLYINGLYWGLFNPTERATASFGASYLGGIKEDYEALNSGEAIDGANALANFNTLFTLANAGLTSQASYDQIAALLDLESFSDYMLLQQWGANKDWDQHNWYALRNATGGKWHFVSWDSEFMLIDPTDNVLALDTDKNPSRLWRRLLANPDYRLYFADRVQKHCFNGGVLSPSKALALWEARTAQMFEAILGESARWGDYRRDVHPRGTPTPIPLYDRDEEWMAERNRLLTTWFPGRTATLIAQYRAAGYFPAIDAPAFNTHGGIVGTGFNLGLTAPTGTIRYTLDGSDPRTSPTAQDFTAPVPLSSSVAVKARALSGATWSALAEAEFIVGTVAGPTNLVLSEIMYNPVGVDETEFLEFLNISPTDTIDLSDVAITDGIGFTFPLGTTLLPGERILVVNNLAAFRALYGESPRVAGEFGLTHALDNAGERLTVNDATGAQILTVRYNDKAPWPVEADGSGPSLVLIAPATAPNHELPENWRASAGGGNPGATDVVPAPVEPNADDDGDGRSAFLEYALGGSDGDPNDGALLPVAVMNSGLFGIQFTQRLAADDARVLVESSPNLVDWSSDPAQIAFLGRENLGSGLVRMTWTTILHHSQYPVHYLRVRVISR